jgi:hypothetical protein
MLQVHTGVNAIPAERYKESLKSSNIRILESVRDLAVLGIWKTKALSREGINFCRLKYKNYEATFAILDSMGQPKVDVLFSVDPADISSITVRHPKTGDLIRFKCDDQELSEGVSLWERMLVLKYMREKNYNVAKREEYLIAFKELRDNLMRSLLKKGSKISERQRGARILQKDDSAAKIAISLIDDAKSNWLDTDLSETTYETVPVVSATIDAESGFTSFAKANHSCESVDDSFVAGRPKRSRATNGRGKRPPDRGNPPSAAAVAKQVISSTTTTQPQDANFGERISRILAASDLPLI